MKTPYMTVTNSQGRTFTVRYLPVGARYGAANSLTVDAAPLVEFYDATYADDGDGFGPLGQFVSRYYVSTLLDEGPYAAGLPVGGLDLDGGIDVWKVDAASMETVRGWLAATRAADLDHGNLV